MLTPQVLPMATHVFRVETRGDDVRSLIAHIEGLIRPVTSDGGECRPLVRADRSATATVAAEALGKHKGKKPKLYADMIFALPTDTDTAVLSEADRDRWAAACVKWVKATFPQSHLVCANLHLDETSPHIHALIVPISHSGRLGWSRTFAEAVNALGGRQFPPRMSRVEQSSAMSLMQDDCWSSCGQPFGLARGERGATRKKRQIDRQKGLDARQDALGAREAELDRQEAALDSRASEIDRIATDNARRAREDEQRLKKRKLLLQKKKEHLAERRRTISAMTQSWIERLKTYAGWLKRWDRLGIRAESKLNRGRFITDRIKDKLTDRGVDVWKELAAETLKNAPETPKTHQRTQTANSSHTTPSPPETAKNSEIERISAISAKKDAPNRARTGDQTPRRPNTQPKLETLKTPPVRSQNAPETPKQAEIGSQHAVSQPPENARNELPPPQIDAAEKRYREWMESKEVTLWNAWIASQFATASHDPDDYESYWLAYISETANQSLRGADDMTREVVKLARKEGLKLGVYEKQQRARNRSRRRDDGGLGF